VKGAHVVWVEIFGKGSMGLCVIVNFGVKYKGNGGGVPSMIWWR
jgi:hypothetical protein